MKFGDLEWQELEPCWLCNKKKEGTKNVPEWCPWCHQWHCPECINECPGILAWELAHTEEPAEEGGEEKGADEAYTSLDDIPCVTCNRAPKDGVPFVMCPDCVFWHCCECGCPVGNRPDDEDSFDGLARQEPRKGGEEER